MRIHRFIGSIENEEISRQIRTILKLRAGERVIISDGKGHDTLLELTEVGKEIKYKMVKELEGIEIERKVNLYLAILKKENFELAVQKAVECGVSKITPVITERTIKTGLNVKRLEKIILEASEQSGRNVVPSLSLILDFENAILDAQKSDEKIIFHLIEDTYRPDKTTAKAGQDSRSVSIFIGPEGGFTEKEITLAKNNGYTPASLGPLTLRGETAAIIGTYRAIHGI